jgi:hypothetical protein
VGKDVESLFESGGSLLYAQLAVGKSTNRLVSVINCGATGEQTVAQGYKKKGKQQKCKPIFMEHTVILFLK